MSIDAKLLQDDELARTAALDVRRSFIVQAPAGSGKTELLIQRYLKLLAVVDNPEEVLAITFTRKAAAEMQYRVIEALRTSIRGEEPAEAHQELTRNAATEVLRRDAELQWNLIANPGRLRIQTLDSLNAAISRMQPVSSGSGAAHNSVVADAEMHALYRHAAILTLDQLTEGDGELPVAIEAVLLHLDNNTALYASYVARMLATRDQWLPFVGSGQISTADADQLRSRFEQSLHDAVVEILGRLHGLVPAHLKQSLLTSANYAANQLRDAGDLENPIVALGGLRELPTATSEGISLWQSLAELLLTKQGTWRKTANKNQGFPSGDSGEKDAFKDLLAELQSFECLREQLHDARDLPPTHYSDQQWSVLLALFRLLPLAVTELKRLFAERGITDYIEVALSAANALGTADDPGDVALLLDYQLRHLLVDEMQDTASAQYKMLESLTGGWEDGDGRTMFCVGDPMQSIYRFRNAEVGQFLLAKETGIGNVALDNLTLRRNFRSGENLVNWFNNLFPAVLAKDDDATQSAVAYAASVSVPNRAASGECVTHALFGASNDTEARRGCEVVQQILAENPDDDMAILVRSRTHLSKLLANLRRAGVDYRAVEIDRLTDLPEIIDALALTRAIVHHGDRLAWLALLRAPWAGLDWADLHALVQESSADATVLELMQDGERLDHLSDFGQQAVRRLLARLQPELRANRISSLRDQIERLWLALGGPAMMEGADNIANVYRYFDVLEELEQGGTLLDVARLEAALDLEHVSTESNARLQVMTMHRAKGLQFDHVLLYGLGHAPGRQERAVLNWFDVPTAHGNSNRVVSPVGARADVENDPLHRFIEKIESSKYQHELGRLLYVACTRAKRSLHLMGHVSLSSDASEFKAPRSNTLLRLLWPAVSEEFANAFIRREENITDDSESAWVLPALRRFESDWQLPAVPELLPAAVGADIDAVASKVEFYWVGSEARIAGTMIHRWLHFIAEQHYTQIIEELAKVRSTTLRWLYGDGIRAESAEEITGRVVTALERTFADEKGRWLIDGPGHAELALSGILDGEVTSVVLDRVRIDENNTHWIVDYKTSTHEGGNLEAFLQTEVDRYSPQLAKYQKLYRAYSNADTRCALYFPLLQQFVPVTL
ncbi:MAG: UvrD-helicase domain-containing protein [Woeseiaceae bacterium]